jgi:tetratricopeptide (TPR) repeat protein
MASDFNPADRRVIPNFRRFSDTVLLGELDSPSRVLPAQLRIDFDSLIAEWRIDRNVGLAGDIVSAALVSGQSDRPEVSDAANFVFDHPDVSSSSLTEAAQRLFTRDQSLVHAELPRLTHFLEDNSRHKAFQRIRALKSATTRFGHDPILFTELARMYMIVGNKEPAMRNISVALSLAPHNRYVLRSAARLYAHYHDFQRSFDLLHRNPRTREDPWLASAELAMADVIGSTGKVLKRVSRMLRSADFSPLSLTELRAGVGSLELAAGNRRTSKRLLQASLEKPNDNSLAQVEWTLTQERLFDVDIAAFDVSRNFEALAIEAYQRENWHNVIRQCESWLMDIPFASRPALMAAHVASVALEDYPVAQAFAEAARLSDSSNDPRLVNSYAYALALDNQFEKALAVLDEVPLSTVQDQRAKAYLTATRGLAYFRAGLIEVGRAYYATALDAAKEVSDVTFRQLALLSYVREELVARQPIPVSIAETVRQFQISPRALTTEILRRRVVALLETASTVP